MSDPRNTYVLHTFSGSPYGWRAQLALTLKSVPFETRHLSASNREHKSPEFLKLNPRGKVPVLEAGGEVLVESLAMVAWIDRAHPEPPLFGANLAQAARVWRVTMENCEHLRHASHAILAPAFGMAGHARVGAEGAEALRPQAAALAAEWARLEGLLAGSEYLAGDAPSAADLTAYPDARFLERATARNPELMAALGLDELPARNPAVAAWTARFAALPGVSDTYPPHWRG